MVLGSWPRVRVGDERDERRAGLRVGHGVEPGTCAIFNGFLPDAIDAGAGQQQILPGGKAAWKFTSPMNNVVPL